MGKSASQLANELLIQGEGLEELRLHVFSNDEEAHDDTRVDELRDEFSADFERVRKELSKQYGDPWRIGKQDDDLIPLCGVFRFAVWEVGEKLLFIAAAHEDREVPILLMLGTISP